MVVLVMAVASGCGDSGDKLDKYIDQTAAWLVEQEPAPTPGADSNTDWMVLALSQSGSSEVPEDYVESYYDGVRAWVKSSKGILSETEYTTYERVSILLGVLGKDATDVEGYNLMKQVDDYKEVADQGINAEMFALIAAKATGYELNNEARYLQDVLANQLDSGSFSYNGKDEDVDMTAMGIQALAGYQNHQECQGALSKALTYLQKQQKEDGGYDSAESTAQVIIALGMLHKDPLAEEGFQQGNSTLLDGLLEYQTDGGAFSHEKGDQDDTMATVQSMEALTAIKLAQENKGLFEK